MPNFVGMTTKQQPVGMVDYYRKRAREYDALYEARHGVPSWQS